mgnify:CR=1 FL=1
MPIISQCPVTESLPADASAMRPDRRRWRHGGRRLAAEIDDAIEAERAQRRHAAAAPARAMLPSVLLPCVAVRGGVRQLADADAVHAR